MASMEARDYPTHDAPLYRERVRCPHCGGTDVETYRSTDQGDGSVLRYTRCRFERCRCRFKVVFE